MLKSEKILISGAGVAGLSAGIWLARQGFRPVIVETRPSSRVGGFLVSLSHTAYACMEELGVMPALLARGSGITGSSYHNEAGTNLLALDSQKLFAGVKVIQLMRDELVDALHEVAKDLLTIRFEDSITAINETEHKVEVSFRNHADETYDVVIGADGLHSAVRDLAFPATDFVEHYLGLSCAAYRCRNVLGLENKFET
ncbi:MAG: FAD-dependent monooxygenase, partial [Proteobacteria bacterium]|nr:FAD-dependent monooxygenase [Pseudomonadota bacterium]